MKRILLFTGLSLVLFACTKTFNCSCTTTDNHGNENTVQIEYASTKMFEAKKDAEADCMSEEETFQDGDTTYTTTCEML